MCVYRYTKNIKYVFIILYIGIHIIHNNNVNALCLIQYPCVSEMFYSLLRGCTHTFIPS